MNKLFLILVLLFSFSCEDTKEVKIVKMEKEIRQEMNEDFDFEDDEPWRLHPSDIIPDFVTNSGQDFVWELVIKPV